MSFDLQTFLEKATPTLFGIPRFPVLDRDDLIISPKSIPSYDDAWRIIEKLNELRKSLGRCLHPLLIPGTRQWYAVRVTTGESPDDNLNFRQIEGPIDGFYPERKIIREIDMWEEAGSIGVNLTRNFVASDESHLPAGVLSNEMILSDTGVKLDSFLGFQLGAFNLQDGHPASSRLLVLSALMMSTFQSFKNFLAAQGLGTEASLDIRWRRESEGRKKNERTLIPSQVEDIQAVLRDEVNILEAADDLNLGSQITSADQSSVVSVSCHLGGAVGIRQTYEGETMDPSAFIGTYMAPTLASSLMPGVSAILPMM